MNIELISIKPYRNIKATIFSLFVLILYFGLHLIVYRHLTIKIDILTVQTDRLIQTYVIVLWVLTIGAIIWSYRIALRTGREPTLWIVIGFLAGPIGLLILSFKDFFIKDFMVRDIVQKTRLEYKTKLIEEMGETSDKEKKHQRRKDITQDYQALLYDRYYKAMTTEKIGIIKDLADNGIINPDIDLSKKIRLLEKIAAYQLKSSDEIDWKSEWTENESLCPACGTEIENISNNCLNCGLKLK